MICKSWGLFIHFGVILPALALRGSGCDGLLWQGGTSSGAPLPGFWTRDHGVIWEWISCVYIYNYYNVCVYRWLYMYTCIEYVIKFTNNLLWVCLKKWERLPKNAYEMLGKWGFTIMFSFVPGFQTWMDLQSFHPTWQWKIRFVNVEVFNWKNSYG